MSSQYMDVPAIAEHLGVSTRQARYLSGSADFPAPLAELSIGRIWAREAVESWAANRRGPGRPRRPGLQNT